MDINMFWSEIMITVSQSSGQSISDLKRMPVYDFFVMLLNLELLNKKKNG